MLRNKQDRTELVNDLLSRRRLLQDFVERRNALRQEVADYERKFGIPSSELHTALRHGQLTETGEVCRWIISYELLQDLETLS